MSIETPDTLPWDLETNTQICYTSKQKKKCCRSVLHSSALEPKIFPAWCEIRWSFGWHTNLFKSALLWAADTRRLVLIKALLCPTRQEKDALIHRIRECGSSLPLLMSCDCPLLIYRITDLAPHLLWRICNGAVVLRCVNTELLEQSKRCHFNKANPVMLQILV